MISEVTRLFRAWLSHEEYGVRALLQTIPRQRVDGELDPMPVLPTLYDDIDDPEVAQVLENIPVSPGLVVYVDSPADVDVSERHYRKTERALTVVAAYITKDDADAAVASRNGGYTLRAVQKSLGLYNDQVLARAGATNYRELNGIKVMKVGLVSVTPVKTGLGRSQLWGFVLASVTVVDTLA